MSYIGLDVGTSSCKASVIDERIMRASARRTYPLLREKPGWAELDPSHVWRAILEVLAEIAPSARDASGCQFRRWANLLCCSMNVTVRWLAA